MAQLDDYLKRKTAALEARRADFTADPDKALVRIGASSRLAGNSGVRPVRMGDYTVITDSAPGLAGFSLGPTAPEMLLGALASCLAHTYAIQAALLDIPLDSLEVSVSAALDFRGVIGMPVSDAPMLQDICYHAEIGTSAPPDLIEQLHRAVALYCPVLNTLRLPADVRRA